MSTDRVHTDSHNFYQDRNHLTSKEAMSLADKT